MENASLENVSIEFIQNSQNRGDENEYYISSVFDDVSELETAQDNQGGQRCLTSGISANINSRQPQGAAVGRSVPRNPAIRDRGKSPAAKTEGARALTSSREYRPVQSDDSSVYLSASLDDIDAVPNSVTCIPRQQGNPKEGGGAVQKTDDPTKEQNSTSTCSVTINFRLTEDQFCCSSRESSLHLELDIGNLEGTKKRNTFRPQVNCSEQARTTARDAGLRVISKLVTNGSSAQEEVVDLHPPSRCARRADMDVTDDIPESSTLEGPETPEYSPTDSESSETSDEADAMEHDANWSPSPTDVESQFATPAAEESDAVRSEAVVGEKTTESCVDHGDDTSNIHLHSSIERHCFEENMTNLDAEGVEMCKEGAKEDLDGNSILSETSLDSDDNSKTSVVCRNVLDNTDPHKNFAHNDGGNHITGNEKDLEAEFIEARVRPNNLQKGDYHSRKNSKEGEISRSVLLHQKLLDEESTSTDDRSEFVDDERVLSTEMLSGSEEIDFAYHCKENSSTAEGRKTPAIETAVDGETQGQGDTSHPLTDDTSSDCTAHQQKISLTEELLDGRTNDVTGYNGEETQLKYPKSLEHVGEVPRGIFESILYKLYNRMHHRSQRTWRDVSRGPCVKELVKEFSREVMDCPKFPKSHSVQVRKTQQQIPKSQLFESFSDMDESPKSPPVKVKKAVEEIPKSQLFESFSDIDDRRFESRIETSTDDEHLSSDDGPIRSSTPSQEVVVREIRDELQKPHCSRRRVIQLIKKFGGKGSFKKHKKIGEKVITAEEIGEAQSLTKDVVEGSVSKDVTNDNEGKSETLCQKHTACTGKGSSAWLTNVSVKNLVAIFSEISKSPEPSRRSVSRSSKRCSVWPSKEILAKASRTMETQTPGSEAIGSCSNVLLLLQSEYNGSNMLSSRFERKRSTLSVCLPATDLEACEADGGRPAADPLRACASATGLLLVSTAEPVRVRALCSPDDNRTALSQLAHLLHMPDRKAPPQPQMQGRALSLARDSSLVRQMVAQFDRTSS